MNSGLLCVACARQDVCWRKPSRQCSKSYAGPKGRNVILVKSFGAPTVTKGGVLVAGLLLT